MAVISIKKIQSITTLLALFLLSYAGFAQNFTSSNLPIVIITTDINPATGQPYEIPDDPKVPANMKVIFRPDGSRNYVSDQNTAAYLNYNGRIGIETRGSTSQMLPKKPYGLTTRLSDNVSNNNVSILGMPSENDWILNALAYDASLIRDYLSYYLSREIGNYSTRGVYCEVIVNGDYKGLYVFMEKIKIDTDRLNMVKLTTSDNTLPNVSGGYITKADKTTGGDPVAWTMPSYAGVNGLVDYIHENPKPSAVTTQQHNYIRNHFMDFQAAMNTQNGSLVNGFPSMIDIPSFIDFIIINEFASNVDAYQFSTFFHKDRGGKLRAGPIWDLNLTYGNDLFFWGFDRSHPNVWQFNYSDNRGSKFWKNLYDNPTFKCYLAKRWNELASSGGPLSNGEVVAIIDETVNLISEAVQRENQRWGTIGYHPTHIYTMKSWILARITWLNANLNNFQNCANPAVPSLVISKIHYHPKSAQGFAKDDLEFIEITNHSNETVDLTGIYLKELGISYQFPPNSSVAPGAAIRLASNANVFQQFYGFSAFGQYTRYLSNKTHNLVLSDAWGNIIDEVRYFDSSPWPPQADGDGPYLKLIDLDLDNRLPQSWVASNDQLVSITESEINFGFNLYPNPASTSIALNSLYEIVSYEIFDVFGRTVMKEFFPNTKSHTIDLEKLNADTYFIKARFSNDAASVSKFVILK
jgi:hypothetical protein